MTLVAGVMEPPVSRNILGTRIDATSYTRAATQIVDWGRAGEHRTVCAANVHMVMEGHDDPSFQSIVNAADLVTSDGVPLVWALRLLGVRRATRVYGPDLTLHVCEIAAREGVPLGFFGGSPETLSTLTAHLRRRFPTIRIVYECSPPFRPMTQAEDARVVAAIRASGARALFVGLGCPKQERWMHAHRDLLPMPLIAVGAAFDFIAGRKRQAPSWLQRLGLEWLFRLAVEPRRLWRRYLYHNPRFMALWCLYWLTSAHRRQSGASWT